MASGKHFTNFKPRQVRGTPAAVQRNRFGYAILSIGVLYGLIFHFAPMTVRIREKSTLLYTDPIEEIERRQMMFTFLSKRTGDTIRKQEQEESMPNLPYK